MAQGMHPAGRRSGGPSWPRGVSLIWLVYLGFLFVPWLQRRPTAIQAGATAIAIALFLTLYLDNYLRSPRRRLPHVLGTAAIGYALSAFNPGWAVLNVFASAMAGVLERRRVATITLAALQVVVIAFALLRGVPLWTWGMTVFLGSMVGITSLWQAEVSRKNAELLEAQEEVRTLAASAERERIARDLHDLLGHTLTLVAIKAELAERLAERDVATARREMQEVSEAARSALAEVRTAVTGMRAATLAAEIERARRMLAAANVEAEVAAEARPADPEREAVLAMALREAVTNVIRHADASVCRIGVEADPSGGLRLTVADDGRGGEIREGSGLAGMRARLSAAGGALEIRSDGGGTRILASVPGVTA